MDLTEGTLQEKTARSKKMMLWFGIGSLIMSFSALISAFIVSSKQRRDKDWLNSYDLPNAFYISVAIILLSSLTFVLAKKALKQKNRQMTSVWLFVTLALGIAFIFSQLEGFNQIIQTGYNFTGPTSNITMSYIYLIAVVHILHVIAGLICGLSGILSANFELAANSWHFIDLLWLVLFLFLYFFRDII